LAELDRTERRFSQWLPGQELPEKHWLYRWTKRFWFNDFGAYRNAAHDVDGRAQELKKALDHCLQAGDNPAKRT
jgi:hypothetical protein